jgi:AIR synthase-related protein
MGEDPSLMGPSAFDATIDATVPMPDRPQPLALGTLTQRLQGLAGLASKRAIQAPAARFAHQPFPQLGPAAALGDDAALLPALGAPLLLACEGLHPGLVEEDPWFAGWSGVLVNLSDIAAMGGRPLALVNSLWAGESGPADSLLAGMARACEVFGVPMVGGHTNLHSPYTALAVAVLGTAPGPVLSARSARPGDRCVLLVNTSGRFYRHYPFWDAATSADPALLRSHLDLLVHLAAQGLAHGAKDISMGGLVGTAVMFAEAAGGRLELDLAAIQPPPGVGLEAWLACFPSFGFLLAVAPAQLDALQQTIAPYPDLLCAEIGAFCEGAPELVLHQQGERQSFWQGQEPLTGFGALA